MTLRVALLSLFLFASAESFAGSLRFFGNGVNDVDRVKIRIDDPETTAPGPPADIGATDFTLEFWMRGFAADNTAPAISCGFNIDWIYGNIIVDRDRYNQDRKFGISIAGGIVAYGVSGDATGDRTICGTRDVLDGSWHHVAVQRRRSDGRMWLFVDGFPEAELDGPDGDISYPDDGVPANFCGGPCVNSDPFLVIAAEKHDAGPEFPSFNGWFDELRLSSTLRYGAAFTPPTAPFLPDSDTLALYSFDEAAGARIYDGAANAGGPSNGVAPFGGAPAGPVWSSLSPFADPATRPGVVPDGNGVPGVPLTLGKSSLTPGEIELQWSGGCGGAGTDYAIYEGAIGSWYDHAARSCSTGGSTSTTLIPGGGDRYFLVVSRDAITEGAGGVDSAGATRPLGGDRCAVRHDPRACP